MFLVLAFISVSMNSVTAQEEHKEKKCRHHDDRFTEVFMNGIRVEKFGDDSMLVHVDKKKMDDFRFPEFPPFCWGKNKFNGHWAGVGLGINSYVNKDFKMDLEPQYSYMDLNTARSLVVNLNPFELNLNLVKNHFGLVSGLGFQLSNYYFTGNKVLISDSATLKAYKVTDANNTEISLVRNKLFVGYLNIPVLLEIQTNAKHRWNSFHFAVGVIGGVRIGAYTKQVYNTWNQTYYLTDDEGKQIAFFYTDDCFSRHHGSFHLETFKLDATARIGWSFLNFWATYSITPMFQKNKGPELYPWTIGIQLIGW
jgi:hypothetical protein